MTNISANNTETMLKNVVMAAVHQSDENMGLKLIEDLGCYLGGEKLSKPSSEFNLEVINKSDPTLIMDFCINFIGGEITKLEQKLPPLQDRQMLFGQELAVLEVYNRAEMIKASLRRWRYNLQNNL